MRAINGLLLDRISVEEIHAYRWNASALFAFDKVNDCITKKLNTGAELAFIRRRHRYEDFRVPVVCMNAFNEKFEVRFDLRDANSIRDVIRSQIEQNDVGLIGIH